MTKDEVNNLIIENEKLAYLVANRYRNSFKKIVDYEDIKSICLLGLVKAANTYNIDRNINFSTYAYNVIKNELLYNVRYNYEANKKMNETSLDKPLEELDNVTLYTILSDDFDVEAISINNINLELLHSYINELPEELNQIICLHLQEYTQTQIAEELDMSQAKVNYMIDRAINMLRYKFGKEE